MLVGHQADIVDQAKRCQQIDLRLIVRRHDIGVAQPRFVLRILSLQDIDRQSVSSR